MRVKTAKELIENEGLYWDDFLQWMSGQTMGLYEDGTTDIYNDDVMRFIKQRGKKDNVAVWD